MEDELSKETDAKTLVLNVSEAFQNASENTEGQT